MKRKSLGPFIGAVVLFFLVVFVPKTFFLHFITENKLTQQAADLNPDMFDGIEIQKQMLKSNKFLPIYGSSELSRMDAFHPSNYFQENYKGYTPFLIGTGGTESTFHYLNFAVHHNELKGKKIIFILSPQWFTKKGENEVRFSSTFSILKAYQFALDDTFDKGLASKLAKNLLSYQTVKKDPLLTALLEAKVHRANENTFYYKADRFLADGYFDLMQRRDLLISILDSKHRKLVGNSYLTKDKTWDELNKNAAWAAKKKMTNNPFYIQNKTFNKLIKHRLKSLKGSMRQSSYEKSPEYKDFQLVLDVLKTSGAKPLFVSIPVNGYWYDYIGFKNEGRNGYYAKIKKQIHTEGFPVLDLSGHEYDKYFMTDTIHLGYKGWVQIDKGIEEFMNGKIKNSF
ncbi:D-alanyl-lipoteichoic acid biosynthesis protein DltD [Metabacillus sp. RGM 3146]|uniref:D-alanyl-lipoteichoic acid biosynthesis protein DltD n=1 Tax=Metabacillus sp. RGM 3146 TaxID=3401092 RepID=UPI003B997B0B